MDSKESKNNIINECFSSTYYYITNDRKVIGNICQAQITVKLPDGKVITVHANEDPCGSKDLASRHLLHRIKPSIEYSLPAITMTTIQGPSPPYNEIGELHFEDENKIPIVVLCYVQDTPIPGYKNFVLLSNNTLVDLEADINYQAKVSKETGVLPMKRNSNKPFHYSDCNLQELHPESNIHTVYLKQNVKKINLYNEQRCECSLRIPAAITTSEFLSLTGRQTK